MSKRALALIGNHRARQLHRSLNDAVGPLDDMIAVLGVDTVGLLLGANRQEIAGERKVDVVAVDPRQLDRDANLLVVGAHIRDGADRRRLVGSACQSAMKHVEQAVHVPVKCVKRRLDATLQQIGFRKVGCLADRGGGLCHEITSFVAIGERVSDISQQPTCQPMRLAISML